MGKWSYLKDKLPPLPDPNPKHKDLVEESKFRLRSNKSRTGEFVSFYVKLRKIKEHQELERAALQIEIDACESIIKENFEKEGVNKMTLETGETISTSPEPYAVVDDKEKMIAWVKEDGLEPLLTLPWQTMNSHLKQRLENGEEVMPGVTAYIRWKVSFRRN